MPIPLNHLETFDAVAVAGSVTRAAERLMVSQPAVSKQLKQLERSIGAPLFDRLPKGVRPTAAGALLAGYARRIVALRDEAEQALADLRGVCRGSLAVGATTTIGVYLLPDVFVAFRRAHPGVRLELEIAHTDVIRQRLLDGTLDVGLAESAVDDPAFESRAFLDDELVAVAAPGHPLARRRRVTAAALCREPFVVRETGSGTKSLAEQALAERGLSVTPAMSLGSTEAIKRAVAAGVGVAIVSHLSVSLEIAARRLALLKLTDWSVRRPLRVLRVKGRHQSRAAATFVQLLDEHVRASPAVPRRTSGPTHRRKRDSPE